VIMKNLIAISFGIIGMLIALTFWHIYNDHLLIHAVVNALSQPKQQVTQPQGQPK